MNKSKLKLLLDILISYIKIGAFTFGGGYAMIPLIQREAVEKHHWVTDDDILEIISIAESTPGPFAINSATFIGYRVCGFWGSFCATFGVVLPSYVIITLIAYLLRSFLEIQVVQYAFWGIRAGVLALILKAFVTMFKKAKKGVVAYVAMSLAFLLAVFTEMKVIFIVIICAIIGLVASLIAERREKQ